jgi:uracil phosphoribosyltransferase
VQVHVLDHPLVAHKLTTLRDQATGSPVFRRLCEELVTLLAYEATRRVRVEPITVRTPLASAEGVHLAAPKPLVVPILRAGLGMLDGMLRLLPTAEVGFLGLVRDDTTLLATTYADRLPVRLDGRQCFVLDPMLATGGTLAAATTLLLARGAASVHAVCLIGAPEGVDRLRGAVGDADVSVVLAGLDPSLDDRGYISPGLGDAGDRLFGSAE